MFFAVIVCAALLGCYVFSKISDKVEQRVKGYGPSTATTEKMAAAAAATVTKAANATPRYIAAALSSLACFVVAAVLVTVVFPPRSDFNVESVQWDSRSNHSLIGKAIDPVLVRTTGASVEPGFVYSTATLSGQEYTSVLGLPWVATDSPAMYAFGAYLTLGLILAVIATVAVMAVTSGAVGKVAAPAAG